MCWYTADNDVLGEADASDACPAAGGLGAAWELAPCEAVGVAEATVEAPEFPPSDEVVGTAVLGVAAVATRGFGLRPPAGFTGHRGAMCPAWPQ